MTFKNKTIWITGASSGIGEALAYAFASQGANLILSARNESKLNSVASKCEGASKVWVKPLDFSKYEELTEPVDKIIEEAGPIDILINNAGISQRAKVEDSTIEVDKKIFDINYFGVVALTRLVLPEMIKKRGGHMVVISSVAGLISTPYRSAYAASKHAVRAWFDALRAEVYDYGINVTVICPGYIKTDISINALNPQAEKHGKMDKGQASGMSAEECADKILKAIAQNKSEILIGGKETKAVLIKRLFPKILEKQLRTFAPK